MSDAPSNTPEKPTEPRDDIERAFVTHIETARRMFDWCELKHRRKELMRGVVIRYAPTQEYLCSLADDDYLLRFRAMCAKHQVKDGGLIWPLPDRAKE